MLQFQIAGAIQEAIVREYSEYQEADVDAFASWLVQYCVHHMTFVCYRYRTDLDRLQRYVRDAILRAAAVALKRLSLSITYNITPQILQLVHNLADQSSNAHSVKALSLKLT